ncbi:MAG: hypothetical protein QW734_06380 [Candidatus Bathyarchaeia archaeon]
MWENIAAVLIAETYEHGMSPEDMLKEVEKAKLFLSLLCKEPMKAIDNAHEEALSLFREFSKEPELLRKAIDVISSKLDDLETVYGNWGVITKLVEALRASEKC